MGAFGRLHHSVWPWATAIGLSISVKGLSEGNGHSRGAPNYGWGSWSRPGSHQTTHDYPLWRRYRPSPYQWIWRPFTCLNGSAAAPLSNGERTRTSRLQILATSDPSVKHEINLLLGCIVLDTRYLVPQIRANTVHVCLGAM